MSALFQRGDFTLHSGGRADWKIDCDALTDEDWRTLALLGSRIVGRFYAVEGVPRGGLKFAEALRPYAGTTGRVLIVDDVSTTGESLEAQRNGRTATGLVVFNRGLSLKPWVRALFAASDPLAMLPAPAGAPEAQR